MVKRVYATMDQCTLCAKTYKGPSGLWRHLGLEHGIHNHDEKRRHMRQIPNPAYKQAN